MSAKGFLQPLWGLSGKVVYALRQRLHRRSCSSVAPRRAVSLSMPQRPRVWLNRPDTAGVYLVPALSGLVRLLGSTQVVVGLTRAIADIWCGRLESIAYQTRDVLLAMQSDSRISIPVLRVDGGASVNNFLMQFQADVLNVTVERPRVTETTAIGAAFLAGLGCGLWSCLDEIAGTWEREGCFTPHMGEEERNELCRGWREAVKRSLGWAN